MRASGDHEGERLRGRIAELDGEIANIAANFARGVVSDALVALLAEREAEKAQLLDRLARVANVATAQILPHPVLLERYARKVEAAHLALSDPSVREEAADTLRALIEHITVHAGDETVVAEFVSNPARIIDYAYDEPAASGRRRARSIAVVAGVGFEPTTFRL